MNRRVFGVALIAMSLMAFTSGYALSMRPSSVVQDPKGDWETQVSPASYFDIKQAKVDLVGTSFFERTHMRVSMVLDGKIPEMPSEQYLAYVWSFDLDGDGEFNTPGDVNARVAWDGDPAHGVYFGWHAYLDGVDFAGILFTFNINGNTVTFTFPLSYIGNPTSFNWLGTSIRYDGGYNGDHTSIATWPSP